MPKLSYANVVATIALFVALGGTATAAHLIQGNEIAKNTIRAQNLAKGSVNSKKIRNGQVSSKDLSPKLRQLIESPRALESSSASAGPISGYTSGTLVAELRAPKDGIYVAYGDVRVTAGPNGSNPVNIMCATILDGLPFAGGYGPGPVADGDSARFAYAGVAELSAGDSIAIGCQTDGPIDLDSAESVLIRFTG